MKHVLFIAAAILIAACTSNTSVNSNSVISSPASAGETLQCVGCMFVEGRGVRRIRGKIQNNAEKDIEAVVMDVELKDARGNVVVSQNNISLFGGVGVERRSSKEFSQVINSSQANITQATVHLRKAGTGERLSAPITLLLILSLEKG